MPLGSKGHEATRSSFSTLQGAPLQCLHQWRAEQGSAGQASDEPAAQARYLRVKFSLPSLITKEPAQPLNALYCDVGGKLRVAVTERDLDEASLRDSLACFSAHLRTDKDSVEGFKALAAELRCAVITEGEPLALTPVEIDKPWGREIWFTGVEARGVAKVSTETGDTPLSWLRPAIPDSWLGPADMPLLLLKILDPVAEPVKGDLYFELHQKKQECYVVTAIDKDAWPEGVGAMRLGFAPAKLAAYASVQQFRDAYLAAVQAYEVIRRKIDSGTEAGVNRCSDSDTTGDGADARADNRAVSRSSALQAEEVALRGQMNAFIHTHQLAVGDTVQVPPRLPHSLLHGVRVIEFQTAVYERKILSFAQPVLTQAHWDTAAAVDIMELQAPELEPPLREYLPAGVECFALASCSDYCVQRLTIPPLAKLELSALDRYQVIIVERGCFTIGNRHWAVDQALILPGGWQGKIENRASNDFLSILMGSVAE